MVNPGGTNERFARAHVTRAELVVLPDNRGIFAELAAGRGDVMFTDSEEVTTADAPRAPSLCATMPGTRSSSRARKPR